MHSAVIATTVTTPVAAASNRFNMWVRGINVLRDGIELESIRLEESGNAEPARLEFDVADVNNSMVAANNDHVVFHDNLLDQRLFTGRIISRSPRVLSTGRAQHFSCVDYSGVLDTTNVISGYRPAGEGDRARLAYFIGAYGAMLPDRSVASIAQIEASMPAQRFTLQTLRTAIEQIAASASETAAYYVDTMGRVRYFNGTEATVAPYNLRVGTPGGGEMAPEDLSIEWDSSQIINAYYVRGRTAAGSGWQLSPDSIMRYGRFEAYLDAPDSDTAAKRAAVGRAALKDTAYAIPRGTFSATSPYDGWRAHQTLTIAAAVHLGIATSRTFQIVHVSTAFISGDGNRHYEIEFGARRMRYSTMARA